MKRKLLLLLFFVISFYAVAKDNYRLNPFIDVIHYEFAVSVNDSNNIIFGNTIISLDFHGEVKEIAFDLKNINSDGKGMTVSSVLFNGNKIRWTHLNNKVNIILDPLAGEGSKCIVNISYSGIPADGLIISKNKFGNRTFFADHWPDRASNYLPCIDHPSDKATCEFIVTAPAHYKVVASGRLIEESDLNNGTRLTHWKEDVPLALKVMTFGAASFAVQFAGDVNGTPVWTWVYPENRKEGFNDYSVALKPLAFYSKLIGPYSYEKLANVQSKTIFGGLENAGCIFYSESSVTGQGKAETLIAHEIAHQWFGNSVTEKDWHHIWLSEGFATYLTSVYMEMTYGKDKLYESMKSARDRVIRSFDRTPGPVIDTTITDLMRLLSTNSYQKGAWVLHMLRQEIGESKFWNGMKLFYERYRNGNALTDDFMKTMEEVSGKKLEKFFHQWLYVAGQPDLRITTEPGKSKGTIAIVIEQTQNYVFSFTLDILIKDSGGIRTETIPVKEKISRLNIKGDSNAELTVDPEIKLLFRQLLK